MILFSPPNRPLVIPLESTVQTVVNPPFPAYDRRLLQPGCLKSGSLRDDNRERCGKGRKLSISDYELKKMRRGEERELMGHHQVIVSLPIPCLLSSSSSVNPVYSSCLSPCSLCLLSELCVPSSFDPQSEIYNPKGEQESRGPLSKQPVCKGKGLL